MKIVQCNFLKKYCRVLVSIENGSVGIEFHGKKTAITSAYSPHFSPNFANDIKTIMRGKGECSVMADLNAKHVSWYCDKNNRFGNVLYKVQSSDSFFVHNTYNFYSLATFRRYSIGH